MDKSKRVSLQMYFSLECCARDRERSLISRVCAR